MAAKNGHLGVAAADFKFDPQTARRALVLNCCPRCSLAAGALSMIYPIAKKVYNPLNHCISAEVPFLGRLTEPVVAANQLSEIGQIFEGRGGGCRPTFKNEKSAHLPVYLTMNTDPPKSGKC